MHSQSKSVQVTGAGTDLDLGFTGNELLAELTAAYRDEQRQPGEITMMEFAEAAGISRGAARDYLDKAARDGKLVKRTTVGGRVYFRKVE